MKWIFCLVLASMKGETAYDGKRRVAHECIVQGGREVAHECIVQGGRELACSQRKRQLPGHALL